VFKALCSTKQTIEEEEEEEEDQNIFKIGALIF